MAMKNKKKIIEHYSNLPWTYTIETAQENDQKYFIVYVNELPGICTDNVSIEQAMKDIKQIIATAIEMKLDAGDQIPEPVDPEKYKGNIAYRTSSTRHHLLAKEAKRKGVSLSRVIDQFVDSALGKPS